MRKEIDKPIDHNWTPVLPRNLQTNSLELHNCNLDKWRNIMHIFPNLETLILENSYYYDKENLQKILSKANEYKKLKILTLDEVVCKKSNTNNPYERYLPSII